MKLVPSVIVLPLEICSKLNMNVQRNEVDLERIEKIEVGRISSEIRPTH